MNNRTIRVVAYVMFVTNTETICACRNCVVTLCELCIRLAVCSKHIQQKTQDDWICQELIYGIFQDQTKCWLKHNTMSKSQYQEKQQKKIFCIIYSVNTLSEYENNHRRIKVSYKTFDSRIWKSSQHQHQIWRFNRPISMYWFELNVLKINTTNHIYSNSNSSSVYTNFH